MVQAKALSHHLCKLLILRGGTGGFACRSGFLQLVAQAASLRQIPSFSHASSSEMPSWRFLDSISRRRLVEDFRR